MHLLKSIPESGGVTGGAIFTPLLFLFNYNTALLCVIPQPQPPPLKYDIVHMRDQAFLKQPLNEFGSYQKTNLNKF